MKLHIHKDITKAETLPASVYRNEKFFEKTKEKIFSRSWNYLGHADEFPTDQNVFPKVILEGLLNEPVVFTKDKKGSVHCISNVCTHRGNLVADKSCHKSQLGCRYHGRKFQLDGTFISMPEFEAAKNFPGKKDHLPKIPFAQWGKLFFASPDPHQSFEKIFAPVKKRLAWLPVDEFVYAPERSTDYILQANWMLYCDNYLEGFHIPYVHPSLNKQIDFSNYKTELFEFGNLQLGVAKEGKNIFDIPSIAVDAGQNIAAYYFWIFPNLMLNFYPWGLSMNIICPLKVDLTRIEYRTFVWKPERLGAGAGANPETVEIEDEEMVMQVQKGIQSQVYERGRYSPSREEGVHQFHLLLSEFMQG